MNNFFQIRNPKIEIRNNQENIITIGQLLICLYLHPYRYTLSPIKAIGRSLK